MPTGGSIYIVASAPVHAILPSGPIISPSPALPQPCDQTPSTVPSRDCNRPFFQTATTRYTYTLPILNSFACPPFHRESPRQTCISLVSFSCTPIYIHSCIHAVTCNRVTVANFFLFCRRHSCRLRSLWSKLIFFLRRACFSSFTYLYPSDTIPFCKLHVS